MRWLREPQTPCGGFACGGFENLRHLAAVLHAVASRTSDTLQRFARGGFENLSHLAAVLYAVAEFIEATACCTYVKSTAP
ncbi:MAG: hypothetical protein IM638_06710 [Bacteroidetes bacterium]|nr:hypothetical protein [Bacteroidota bacterium]